MVGALSDIIDQSKNVEGQIIMATNSTIFNDVVWVLVESTSDKKIYDRMFKGKSMVLPAVKEENKKPNCLSVEKIVTNVLRKQSTEYIIGIRDTDYTRYWHNRKYSLPKNIVHTHHRDIEMTMLSAASCQTALNTWDGQFKNKISECFPFIRYMGYLRVWFENFVNDEIHNLKKFRWGKILEEDTRNIANDWKTRLIDRFNELCDTNLKETELEDYAQIRGLDKVSDYDICRGHDLLPCLANRMVRTHIYTELTIREKMTQNYSPTEFWNSITGKRINDIAKPWKKDILKK